MLEGEYANHLADVLSALGNPTRLKIVLFVAETKKPLHIKAIAQMLRKEYATVYRHVRILQENGILGIYEVGRSRVLYLHDLALVERIIEFAKYLATKKQNKLN